MFYFDCITFNLIFPFVRSYFKFIANVDDSSTFLSKVSFDEVMTISAVSTQGASRYTRDQYVKQFTVKFLAEGSQWFDYLSGKVSRSVWYHNVNQNSVFLEISKRSFSSDF